MAAQASKVTVLTIKVVPTSVGKFFAFVPKIEGESCEPTMMMRQLGLPYNKCMDESIVVRRGDVEVLAGRIRWTGGHAASPMFYWEGKSPENVLRAGDFKEDDVIEISPYGHSLEPMPRFDRLYWLDMVGIVRSDLLPAYIKP